MTIDDCMEFFVAGAAAVQIGTASFAEPVASARLLAELPAAVREAGAARFTDVVGTLQLPRPAGCVTEPTKEHADAG
jgi:dihydroorotate dehydrogenase (NAD+) catalytic subunit